MKKKKYIYKILLRIKVIRLIVAYTYAKSFVGFLNTHVMLFNPFIRMQSHGTRPKYID